MSEVRPSLPTGRSSPGSGWSPPTGIGTEAWWKATHGGPERHRRITRFDPARYADRGWPARSTASTPRSTLERRLIVQTDRWTWMALAATRLALDDAGSTRPSTTRTR